MALEPQATPTAEPNALGCVALVVIVAMAALFIGSASKPDPQKGWCATHQAIVQAAMVIDGWPYEVACADAYSNSQ